MIRLKQNSAESANPKRQQAEAMMARLKRVLETETGRGYVTVNHYLTAKGVVEGESEEVQQQAFMPRNDPGTGFYELQHVVATGGMGAVLSAKDKNLQRTVALKVMLTGGNTSDDAVYRFVAEAQITGQLEHPNIVPLHEMGVAADGTIFYTMKLIEGTTLREVLTKIKDGDAEMLSRYDLSKLLTIFQKVCDGMAYAHSRNIVHRDLKPDNVMIGAFGEVLVLDWGLAKLIDPGDQHQLEDGAEEGAAPAGDGFQTMAGQIKGTPNYMAPEQAEGRVADIDARTDIYALGAILYSILTLYPPVSGTSLQEILDKVTTSDIASPLVFNTRNEKTGMVKMKPTAAPVAVHPLRHMPEGKIPSALSAIAMKAMALLREDRYQVVDELQLDIAKYQGGYSTSAEKANPLTELMLFARRNKRECIYVLIAIVLMVAVALGFMSKVYLSERKARQAEVETQKKLEELRATAPTFQTAAEAAVRVQNFTEALEKIDFAIKLAGSNANFHLLRGNILQSQLQLREAQEAYMVAKGFNSSLVVAEQNRSLCGKILSELKSSGATNLNREQLVDLYNAMRAQGREVESYAIQAKLGKGDEKIFINWREALVRGGIKAPLVKDNNDDLRLDLSSTPITSLAVLKGIPLAFLNLSNAVNVEDLSVLKGMPLKELVLTQTKVSDLRPLKGAPVIILSLENCPNLLDLTPLEGMPLTRLALDNALVTDITPLRGMKLTYLSLYKSKVRDLSPLAGMPLTYLNLEGSRVIDLTPLKGAPLNSLYAASISVSKITALAGMPIKGVVDLTRTSVSDISALKGMSFHTLLLDKTTVSDLSPIRGIPLKRLSLSNTKVADISAVASMPLSSLNLADTLVSDISVLRGLPLDDELDLSGTQVRDISALQGLPLKKLFLQRTDISDVNPLAKMPVQTLRLDNCANLKNLLPLWDCQQLINLSVPFPSPNVDTLRQMPNLKRLGYEVPAESMSRVTEITAFWKDFDARKK